MVLCVPCGQQFTTQHGLEQHLHSAKHRCEDCNRFFKSTRSKQQHIKTSRNHLVRAQCGKVDNTYQQDLRHDLEIERDRIPALVGVSIVNDFIPPYTGEPRAMVTPVFKLACQLRFLKPDVEMLLRRIDTQLDRMVVSALIEAALQLLPPDDTPEGKLKAKERMQEKIKRALVYETSFINQTRGFGYRFLTEGEQKESHLHPTPDIRFLAPVWIHGHLCHWIEYKSYFGFKANPFIASKDKKQFRKYVSELGSGAVVYKLGFETDHIVVPGISLFREIEFLHLLERQVHG